MKLPIGFTTSGLSCGIKPSRKDLALVVSDRPASAAGSFTRNLARAAPVLDAQARLPMAGVRGVVINSGNANALTGPQGLEDVGSALRAVGLALGTSPGSLLMASTGVIGMRLPVHKIEAAAPRLVAALVPDAAPAAEAILTTDTRVKVGVRTVRIGGVDTTLTCFCKGSGMIAPSLATMIAVFVSDCAISPALLDRALQDAVARTFNALTVDGDMSTNDAAFALANGASGAPAIEGPGEALGAFTAALTDLAAQMAKEIAADGEGATRLLTVQVGSAPSDEAAIDLARAVAGSSLVKAAVFGADPNWGRVLASLGARGATAGHAITPADARVCVQGTLVYDRAPVAHDPAALRARMRLPEVLIEVELRAGEGRGLAHGCDLSYDYVKINADYTSLIVPSPEGGVAKDDRLANYSPQFKERLLVEALGYIRRFTGTRCVIKYGGAAMVKDALKKSFCDDVALLRSVGLQPIVVHGGGPEISRTLEKLGGKSEFIGGVRITTASDLKVVEMVLTGSINTELVTLLNQEEARAVGISGKDGGLLRARRTLGEAGEDLGEVGAITKVNGELLEVLLRQGYTPVISPVGLGEDGKTYNINADAAAAQIALALHAEKLIYLSDVPGILQKGELVERLDAADLTAFLDDGTLQGGMRAKARSVLEALGGGVRRVHLIDGRVPHSIIAELFTDRGVGTLVEGAP